MTLATLLVRNLSFETTPFGRSHLCYPRSETKNLVYFKFSSFFLVILSVFWIFCKVQLARIGQWELRGEVFMEEKDGRKKASLSTPVFKKRPRNKPAVGRVGGVLSTPIIQSPKTATPNKSKSKKRGRPKKDVKDRVETKTLKRCNAVGCYTLALNHAKVGQNSLQYHPSFPRDKSKMLCSTHFKALTVTLSKWNLFF